MWWFLEKEDGETTVNHKPYNHKFGPSHVGNSWSYILPVANQCILAGSMDWYKGMRV